MDLACGNNILNITRTDGYAVSICGAGACREFDAAWRCRCRREGEEIQRARFGPKLMRQARA
jgi:hypothetical protein